MKKIYILTAVFALLTLSLNAQLKVNKNKVVAQPKSLTEKVDTPPDGYFRVGPSRASTDPVTTFPYTNGFDNSTEQNWWEIIDANNDQSTWEITSYRARYHWNSGNAANDWLVTAPVYLVAGRTYKFYIDAAVGYSTWAEKVEVKLASANDATVLSNGATVIAATTLTNEAEDFITLSNENVTVTTTGNYYFGIHAISNADMYYLYVDDLKIDVEAGPTIDVSPKTLTISDSGTNNTFTVQGSNLGNDNVGVTVPQGSAFLTTTTDQGWGFINNNGSVNGTVTVTYDGRALRATETVTVANNLTSATVDVTYEPNLYIYCDYGASPWNFSANPAVAMVNNGDGTYTATLQNIPANSHILFGRTEGLTYYWEGDNNRLFFGASTDGGDWGYGDNTSGYLDTDAGNDYPVKYHPIYFSEGGSYTITINANDYTFTIDKLVYPAPENVVATANSENQTATVTWDAPSNLPTVPGTINQSVTEDFENGATGWTFIDADGDGYNWTWNDNSSASSNMITNSGNCIVYSESYRNNESGSGGTILYPNNWMISPEVVLDGTLSLYACGQDANGYHKEVFGVYVCVGSYNGISSFVQVGADVTTTHDMTEYTFDLSQYQGQLGHIAIVHHNVSDQFILNIDDITYQIAVPSMVTMEPESYNIYLDGVLVGNVNANNPLTYTFNNVSAGDHTAAVSAVYEGGIESERVPADFNIVPKTDAPAISVVPGETAYTITATAADPNAAVVMTVDGVEYTGTGSVSVTIDRGTSDKNVAVSATAQEDGKLVSDPAEQTVNVPMLPITPTPTITYEQTNATVVVTATGEGTVYLEVDGQTASGEGTVSITIMRSIDDKTVTANATAVDTNHQPSATASEDITIPALAGNPATAKEGLLRMHLLVVDQFKEEIPDDNSHPDRYGYVLKWEEPANVADHKESGTVEVEIKKTEAQVNGYYTLSQVNADTNHDNSEITLDVLTADVGMYLPGEDPDVLYYEMQSKKDANPALGEDYITQLQYIKNAQKYEEMLATSPNKTHQYSAEETYHYFDDSTPIITGTYGVNFMTYAPSVSTWGIQRRYFETDGLDNTYGAPIWKTGVGQVRVISTEAQLQRGPQGSTQWDGVGGPCSLVFLGVEAFGDLPSADVSNIQYEPYMFRVWVQSPGNNLRGCSLIGEHVDPNKPGEHWAGDGTCYGAVPVLVYEQLTSDGHLYKHVQSMEEGNNVEWGEKIQFGALDSGISDLTVYVRFYYRSTGQGISGTRFTLRGNRDGDDETPEVPGYYASEGDGNPDITTGINGVYSDLNKPVESVTYVNAQGMTNDQPFDGVNIVITRYTDGTMITTKVVR